MLTRIVTRHKAGDVVPGGIYWNRKTWDLTPMPQEGGPLRASEGATDYYRLPLLLVMVLGPLAGIAFVLFLPLAVPIMVLYATPKAIAAAIHRRREAKNGLRPAELHRLGGGHR